MSIETGVQAYQEQSGHDDASQGDCPVDTGFDEFKHTYETILSETLIQRGM
jgi:hypothetical protein